MLNWIEKMKLRRLQKRLIRMENMAFKLKKWIKTDRKEAKRLMNKNIEETPGDEI